MRLFRKILYTALMYILLVFGLFGCLVGCSVYSGAGALVGIVSLTGSAMCAMLGEEVDDEHTF